MPEGDDIVRKPLVTLTILVVCAVGATPEVVPVGVFSRGNLFGWQPKTFQGHTDYRLVTVNGVRALKATSDAAASGLIKQIRVDLTHTPFLTWRWRVDNVLPGLDEHSKSGDDYPARVYIILSGGFFFWNTRSLNYVWSSSQPIASAWTNAYTSNVMMIAVESGSKKLGQWVTEKRNIRADFLRYFGRDVTTIDAAALMTDTDNSGQRAIAYYGDLYFTEH